MTSAAMLHVEATEHTVDVLPRGLSICRDCGWSDEWIPQPGEGGP